ncbi:lipid-A-disaccharide synthase [Candidatus Nitrosacidococcus tergens]|uniref:lipid-A-disaccharide synthase n=1 Tax=Candidatus Nitrosacidococcus tergens TaxID=553981 RepID=UPI0018D962F0|nr:lipid-A-disaccharide synthase [Candidatus Nitrosacidococcus tergens]
MENDQHPQLVAIVAGEASGDHHGADLVSKILATSSKSIRFCGIGGSHMKAAGVEILHNSAHLAVIGLVEILSHFRKVYKVLRKMRQFLKESRPDLLILIDYPEFNLRLAKTAKQLGIKVLYYISPQIWAWREYRVHQIKKLVDMMAVIFPFEVPFYDRAGVPVCFVGHPLKNKVKSNLTRNKALTKFGLESHHLTLGLFPGSRKSEIKRILPILIQAAEKISLKIPNTQYLLPLASTLTETELAPYLAKSTVPIKVISHCPYDVMVACDSIIAASGTVTLEIALIGAPMIVVYKVKAFTYWIGRLLIKVKYIALCNIIAEELVVPELIQAEASPEHIAEETLNLLQNENKVKAMKEKFEFVKARLEIPSQINISNLALEMLNTV